MNSRKVWDEANVVAGMFSNKLFAGILLGEAALQVIQLQTMSAWLTGHSADAFLATAVICTV